MADARSVPRGEAIDRAVVPGVLARIVAAAVMGLFAMIAAATWRHLPASTPLREIAALANPDRAAGRMVGRGTPSPGRRPLLGCGQRRSARRR